MTEETNNTTLSTEEVDIINAAFRLHEIVILHRCHKRGRSGQHQFTYGAVQSAEKALAHLRPCAPGADPVRVAAEFARLHDVARAAVRLAIEGMKKAKNELWEHIRAIELSDAELKTITDEAPIFRKYRAVTTLERAIKELGRPRMVSKVANLAFKLANRVRLNAALKAEASNG
jgi:hypothetical protein